MPNILLRDVSEATYRTIADRAKRQHRSVPGEVLYLLDQLLTEQDTRLAEHDAAVAELQRRYSTRQRLDVSISDLIREAGMSYEVAADRECH